MTAEKGACLDIMPIAWVVSIHFEGDKINALLPASGIKASNSTPLNPGLCNFSHKPRNSIVVLDRIQFLTISLGSLGFLYRAILVNEI